MHLLFVSAIQPTMIVAHCHVLAVLYLQQSLPCQSMRAVEARVLHKSVLINKATVVSEPSCSRETILCTCAYFHSVHYV